MKHGNLADIRHKVSIIYKHIISKHNELRYQVKILVISEKLTKEKKKLLHLSRQLLLLLFFFFVEKKKKKNNNKHAIRKKKKKNLILACEVRANLSS
jgi:hypothetical protein